MILSTTFDIPGKKVKEVLGIVKGNDVKARHLGKDIVAGIRNIVGGEINEYTKLLAETREQAANRMVEEAEKLGADAIVGVRFSTSSIMQGASEMLVYGTAVKLS